MFENILRIPYLIYLIMSRNMLYLYHAKSYTKINILPEEIIRNIYSFLPINTKNVLENNDLMRYIMSFNACKWCNLQMSKNNTTVCNDCHAEMLNEIAWHYGSEI